MVTKIQKWGNSLGLRIPRPFALEAGLGDKVDVELTIADGALEIRPLGRRRYELEGLLDGVTAKNRHREQDLGSAVGREVW